MTELIGRPGSGRRIGVGGRPGVVVIDLQKGFTDTGVLTGSDLDDVVEAANALVGAARAAGAPVFFIRVEYEEAGGTDAGIWQRKHEGTALFEAGSRNAELDDRLDVRPEDVIVPKKYASAFFGTTLASRLTTRGVDTVLIAGTSTSGCVRATTVDAMQHGFVPI